VSMSQTTTASGKVSTAKFGLSYVQGNAGSVKSLRLRIYKVKDPKDTDTADYDLSLAKDATSYERTTQLVPLDDTGFCYSMRFDLAYDAGDIVQSNISGKEYMIYAGTITKTINVYCERKYLFGYLAFGLDSEDEITGDTINEAVKAFTILEYDDDDIKNAGYEITFQNESKAQTLILAEPENKATSLKMLLYKQQGYDALDLFAKKTHVTIKDDVGLSSGLSPLYTVYYLSMKQPIKSDMTFKLIF
jgi:hypothetical protein